MRRHRALVVGLVLTAGVAAAAGWARDAATQAGASQPTHVASAATRDFRVVLTAVRTGGGGAPTAAVTATTSERVRGRWQGTGTHRLKGPYFWHTVTGPRAVCRLELRTSGTQPSFRPTVAVRLLLSPSLGCGPTNSYPLRDSG